MLKNALQEEIVIADIPVSFIRFLQQRTDERVLEIVVVYEGVDRWDTVIKPDGMRTDPKVVIVDYNHKGAATGAYVKNFRVVENYQLEDGTVLQKALIADLHVPKDAQMFYFDSGIKKSNGNLYEAVNKGQVPAVSVEFKPYKGKQTTDIKTGITTFHEWDLICVSMLDIAPGQPYSGYKIVRSIKNNMNLNDIIKTKLSELEEPFLVETVTITASFESEGKKYMAVIESGENIEDIVISDVTPVEETAYEPKPTTSVEDDRIYDTIPDPDKEEMRATITKLVKRMDEIESFFSEQKKEVEEEARVRSLVAQHLESAKKKVETPAGDPKSQLGEEEQQPRSFSVDDMNSQLLKAKLYKSQ
jgi:hypothetical protein